MHTSLQIQSEGYGEETQPPGILTPVSGVAHTSQQAQSYLRSFTDSSSRKLELQIFHDHLFAVAGEQVYFMGLDEEICFGFDEGSGLVWFECLTTGGRQNFSTNRIDQFHSFVRILRRKCPQKGFDDNFIRLSEFGHGNKSKTWLCRSKSEGITYLVKIQNQSARVQSEIDILKEVQHPNLVFMREFFMENGVAYIVMDYENGGSLLDLIRCHSPSNVEKLKVVIDMINALEFLRIKGIIHRDIKPQNIVFSKTDGNFKICDFGLAIKSTTKITSISGTPGYMAPQLFRIHDIYVEASVEQDIYSMGLTLFQLFTGKRFYDGVDAEELLDHNVKGVSFKGRKYQSQDAFQVEKKLLEKMIRRNAKDRKNSYEIMQSSIFSKINRIYGAEIKLSYCGKTKAKSSSSDEDNFLGTFKKLLKIQTA